MYMPPNTCPICWKGQYVNGICTSCHHKITPISERRADALPLRAIVKNRYVIGEVLGNGGFGITYSAWDEQKNCRVALKELYPRQDMSREADNVTVRVVEGQEAYFSELMIRFEDEAELLRSLGEDLDVMKVYDLFHANGTVYYSMEYLDGCDLRTYLKKHGRANWNFLRPKLIEILRTLEVLHDMNLIHRDISPDNLFLTKDDKIRLIDFGSARTYQGSSSLTTFIKPNFSPWEQIKTNGKQGPYTDIYALSATVYMMLTGKLPPRATDRIYGTQMIPLKKLCPTMPDEDIKAIEKGMNVKPEDRFQTATEFIHALTGSTLAPDPPQPHPPKQEKLTYWIQGRSGHYKGKRMRLEKNREFKIGRLDHNDIPFPKNTYGVSRNQCSVFISAAGDIYVKDNNSSYGTYLNDQKVGTDWTKVMSGSYLRLGESNEWLQLYYTSE